LYSHQTFQFWWNRDKQWWFNVGFSVAYLIQRRETQQSQRLRIYLQNNLKQSDKLLVIEFDKFILGIIFKNKFPFHFSGLTWRTKHHN
jgi:hypothetical protein